MVDGPLRIFMKIDDKGSYRRWKEFDKNIDWNKDGQRLMYSK